MDHDIVCVEQRELPWADSERFHEEHVKFPLYNVAPAHSQSPPAPPGRLPWAADSERFHEEHIKFPLYNNDPDSVLKSK